MKTKKEQEPKKGPEPEKEQDVVLCIFEEADTVCLPVKRGAPQNDHALCELCIKFRAMKLSDSARMFASLGPALQQMSGTVGQLTGRHYVGVPPELQQVGIAVGEMPPARLPQTPDEAAELFMEQSDDATKEDMLKELERAEKSGVAPPAIASANAHLIRLLREWKASKSK